MAIFSFKQVDVFSSVPLKGNPLAVVIGAEGLNDAQMSAFANWTNLSETTFLLPPTVPEADYRVRIFTPHGELPFAGHPTLGTCHAWLEVGGVPKGREVVQECAAGLVRVRHENGELAFAAPPLRRSGPVDPELMEKSVPRFIWRPNKFWIPLGSITVPAGWPCVCPRARKCWRRNRISQRWTNKRSVWSALGKSPAMTSRSSNCAHSPMDTKTR